MVGACLQQKSAQLGSIITIQYIRLDVIVSRAMLI